MAGIEIRDVRKAFRDAAVLHGVSLDIADGEFLTLVGPSGCGKTTLLRIIAGLETHDAGEILIGGRRVDDAPPKARDVAMVFQSYALYPYMTVAENIALPLVMRRMNGWQRMPLVGRLIPGAGEARQDIGLAVEAVARALGITHLLDRRPGQLSGGQRQRVALARAMVREPAVFLMDEPLSNLDAKMRVQARTEIADLHRRLKTTFVYVTHDQVEAMTMSDRVAVMLGGRLLQVAPPQVIYDEPATLEVARFIGTPEINVLPAIARADGAITALGQIWPLATGLAAGTPFSVTIRAEALSLAEDTARQPAIRGRIHNLERLGSETLVHVDVAALDRPVVAKVPPQAAAGLQPGNDTALTPDLARVLAFDAAGAQMMVRQAASARMREVVHG